MAPNRSALELEDPQPRWEEHANPGRELEHLEPVWEPVPGWEPDRWALELEHPEPRWEEHANPGRELEHLEPGWEPDRW